MPGRGKNIVQYHKNQRAGARAAKLTAEARVDILRIIIEN